MEREARANAIVGGFVLLVLAGLAAIILSLSSDSSFFRDEYKLEARFENVAGLLPNAPVWLAGKEVGRVAEVEFEPMGGERPIRVILHIDTEVRARIRADSKANIGTIGVLGDSYIEVSLGSSDAPLLAEGDEIETVTPANLGAVIAKSTAALDSVAELALNLNQVVTGFSEEAGGERVAQAIAAVSDIVLAVKEGEGLLHSVIYDSYEGGGVESIESSLASLEHILAEVRDGTGILHTLIYESTTDQDIIREALEAGARLNSILSKIDRGEGSLGMLLNDPTVYEDLKILLGGAQRSAVLRTILRMATDVDE